MKALSPMSGKSFEASGLFEQVAAYLADIVYNILYKDATVKAKGGHLPGMYRNVLQSFVMGARNDAKCYRQLMDNLYEVLREEWAPMAGMKPGEFRNFFAECFIPAENSAFSTFQQKDEILNRVLCNILASLEGFVLKEGVFNRVVANRNKETAEIVSREMVSFTIAKFNSERALLYNKFRGVTEKTNEDSSIELIAKMRAKLHELVKKNVSLTKRLREAEDDLSAADDECKKLQRKNKGLLEREQKYLKLIDMLSNRGGVKATQPSISQQTPARLAETGTAAAPGTSRSSDFFESAIIPASAAPLQRRGARAATRRAAAKRPATRNDDFDSGADTKEDPADDDAPQPRPDSHSPENTDTTLDDILGGVDVSTPASAPTPSAPKPASDESDDFDDGGEVSLFRAAKS